MDGTLALKKYNLVERVEALEEGGSYVLPIATAETLGGVKIGEGLNINAETGVLSANTTPYTPPAYSTSEQNTGVKWIDGKEIYRKVFVFENVAASTAAQQAHNITGLDKTVKLYGVAITDTSTRPLPYVDDAADYQRNIYVNDTNVGINGYTHSAAISIAYVVMEYTKTEVTKKKK